MKNQFKAEQVDGDNPQWTDAMVAAAVRLNALPPTLRNKLRGPQKAPLKKPTTIRLDADVLAAARATGKGWQTRINDLMRREFLRS